MWKTFGVMQQWNLIELCQLRKGAAGAQFPHHKIIGQAAGQVQRQTGLRKSAFFPRFLRNKSGSIYKSVTKVGNWTLSRVG